MKIGSFSVDYVTPVDITYTCERGRRMYHWTTTMHVSDVLGLQGGEGWLGKFFGWAAKSRQVKRAQWTLSGSGECKKGAEARCLMKVEKEGLMYLSDYASSAAIARGIDFVATILTIRADFRISAAFFLDGSLGAMMNAKAAAKIMEGARNAKQNNCSCSQYGY